MKMNLKEIIKSVYKIMFNDLTIFGSLIFQLFLIIFFFVIKEFFLSLELFVATIFIYLIVLPIRYFYHKERPKKIIYKNLIEKLYSSSFPSMHAIRAVIMTLLIPYYYHSWLVFTLFFLLAIIILVSRYVLRKHYFIDILVGIILGTLIAWISSWITFQLSNILIIS